MLVVSLSGGLGNQMFEYAFYKMLSKKRMDVKVDIKESWNNLRDIHNGYELKQVFGIEPPAITRQIREQMAGDSSIISRIMRRLGLYKNLSYKVRPLEAIKYDQTFVDRILSAQRDLFLMGYWQSEKYFLEVEDELRQDFIFPDFTSDNQLKLRDTILNTESVSIHIRRGDYLSKAGKNMVDLCETPYYDNAIEYIESRLKNPVYYIFSNDMAWCKNKFKMEKIFFVDGNTGRDSYRDMQFMALCKHNVIANSSFSWWGAWLNENKGIKVAPMSWFVNVDGTEDLIPKGWYKIKV